MSKIHYPEFNETIYSTILANGLKVILVPKSDYQTLYGMLTINYGAMDNTILANGQIKVFPKGIAHFLEHQLFNKENYDASEIFASYGAETNAFTSFNKTGYLFSTTTHLKENLNLLLDFVQIPYFNEKNVVKEQGIIKQEIRMYQDDPDTKLYYDTIANMYPHSVLSNDIAGSENSILKINNQELYKIHELFYHPTNTSLVLVGNFEPELVLKWINENQNKKHFKQPPKVASDAQNSIDQSKKHFITQKISKMDVTRPKVSIGIRGTDQVPQGANAKKYELAINLFLAMLFSENSSSYQYFYKKGIFDDSLFYDFEVESCYHFVMLSGDTDKPDAFIKAVRSLIKNNLNNIEDWNEDFSLAKKEEMGNHISMMNSIEALASQMGNQFDNYTNLYEETKIINDISLKYVKKVAQEFLKSANFTTNIIKPQK